MATKKQTKSKARATKPKAKKAAAKTGNKVDDLLVAQLEKALFDS